MAQHYRYEWWKDGNVKVESQEQTLIEYQEEMSQPASGSALTIGKIQVNFEQFFMSNTV